MGYVRYGLFEKISGGKGLKRNFLVKNLGPVMFRVGVYGCCKSVYRHSSVCLSKEVA